MLLPLITIILLLFYALLFIYYWRGWQSLSSFTSPPSSDHRLISVIIPARNEEKNIPVLLQSLSEQTYPKEFFEIIVVNDFSTDDTETIVKHFAPENLKLFQPQLSPEQSSKKKAIETGIQNAKGELIVTTDADCMAGKNWLKEINDFYVQHDAAFIAAPVRYSNDKSLLQIFQSLDFTTLQGITAASVATDFHTMCNGANLAYKRDVFFEVKGFDGIDKIATGDDMLLMHKIWKRYPDKVYYLKSREAIVTTQPMPNWKDLFMQRKRWASKSLVYDDLRIIVVLALVLLVNCSYITFIAVAIFNSIYWWYVLSFWIAKTIIEFPFVYSVAKFYEKQKLMKYFFFLQPLHIIFTVITGILSQFGKYEWKGRKTK